MHLWFFLLHLHIWTSWTIPYVLLQNYYSTHLVSCEYHKWSCPILQFLCIIFMILGLYWYMIKGIWTCFMGCLKFPICLLKFLQTSFHGLPCIYHPYQSKLNISDRRHCHLVWVHLIRTSAHHCDLLIVCDLDRFTSNATCTKNQ